MIFGITYHYENVTFDSFGVQNEPLFWDHVNKPIWNINKKNPVFQIDTSAGISFKVEKVSICNYAHLIAKHKNHPYGNNYIVFRERYDANKFIKSIKNMIK